MHEAKLQDVIQGLVGTRTYLPIDNQESIFVLERQGYIHIFKGLESVFGSISSHAIARKIKSMVGKNTLTYHPELLELINGL